MNRVRAEERFAEEVLRRTLSIEVTGRDDGSAPRMPDVLFCLPDGRKGALEVTTIGVEQALEREALAAKSEWYVTGASWTWMIHVGAGVDMRDLRRHLSTLVLACEREGVADPRQMLRQAPDGEAFEWLTRSEVRMHGFGGTSRPGAIDVLPGGGGGAIFEHLDELPAWLGERLGQPDLVSNLDKLVATGRSELHLFLRVHESAMPFSLYYPLAWGSYVPAARLPAPPGLSGLWLAPAWKNPILWWSVNAGWARTDCLD